MARDRKRAATGLVILRGEYRRPNGISNFTARFKEGQTELAKLFYLREIGKKREAGMLLKQGKELVILVRY